MARIVGALCLPAASRLGRILHGARGQRFKEESMPQVQEIMVRQVHSVFSETSLLEVARMMRDRRIGDVLVTNTDGTLRGIVTDRDIVVRADANARPLDKTRVGEICSEKLVKIGPTASIEDA